MIERLSDASYRVYISTITRMDAIVYIIITGMNVVDNLNFV